MRAAHAFTNHYTAQRAPAEFCNYLCRFAQAPGRTLLVPRVQVAREPQLELLAVKCLALCDYKTANGSHKTQHGIRACLADSSNHTASTQPYCSRATHTHPFSSFLQNSCRHLKPFTLHHDLLHSCQQSIFQDLYSSLHGAETAQCQNQVVSLNCVLRILSRCCPPLLGRRARSYVIPYMQVSFQAAALETLQGDPTLRPASPPWFL